MKTAKDMDNYQFPISDLLKDPEFALDKDIIIAMTQGEGFSTKIKLRELVQNFKNKETE